MSDDDIDSSVVAALIGFSTAEASATPPTALSVSDSVASSSDDSDATRPAFANTSQSSSGPSHKVLSPLLSVPSSLFSFCIGVYLTDFEASKLASCCFRLLEQLQKYVFKKSMTTECMWRLVTRLRRPVAAFGYPAHVNITSARDWIETLPRLPAAVEQVSIAIHPDSKELDKLYPQTAASQQNNLVEDTTRPIVCLPSTVTYFRVAYKCPEIIRWLDHIIIPINSRLRDLRFPPDGYWQSLPRFVRHSLPDTVVNISFPYRHSCCAESYPARWPPNLTTLTISSEENSPFAVDALPPFPSTLTDIDFGASYRDCYPDTKNLDGMMRRLPDSQASINLNRVNCTIITGSWKFPTGLRSLHLNNLKRITHDPVRFSFPAGLRELHLGHFAEPESLNGLLPETLTAISILVPEAADRPFAKMQWPCNLLKLDFTGFANHPFASLLDWTPPPKLTHLNLGPLDVSLQGVSLPLTLRTLIMQRCSHSLALVRFPVNLQHIEFNDYRNAPLLTNVSWPPPGLQSLTLAKYEDEPLRLPPTLTRFVGRANFCPSSFQKLADALPTNLQELDLSNALCCRHPLNTFTFPPTLRIVRVCAKTSIVGKFDADRLPTASQIPNSLRLFQFARDFRADISRLRKWAMETLPPQCEWKFVFE